MITSAKRLLQHNLSEAASCPRRSKAALAIQASRRRTGNEELRRDGVEMIAPHRANRIKPPTQDRRRLSRYMRRWLVERFFAWIQWQRRLLVRWEFTAGVIERQRLSVADCSLAAVVPLTAIIASGTLARPLIALIYADYGVPWAKIAPLVTDLTSLFPDVSLVSRSIRRHVPRMYRRMGDANPVRGGQSECGGPSPADWAGGSCSCAIRV